MYRRALLGIALIGLLMTTACTGPEGPMGPEGPAGVSLLKEYTGTIPASGDYSVDVPEILNLRSSTFVEVYYSVAAAPDVWTLMADGWEDSVATSRTAAVSWTFAKVYLFGMVTGDNYLIKVFYNE